MEQRKRASGNLWVAAAAVILILAELFANRRVPFMMDDLWYATNLATGNPLKNFGDIIQSQIWHYMNWGGRSMTHGALQLTLMSGELCADILNVLMMVLLTLMICIITQRKTPADFLLIHSLLFAFNANIKMSVLWQAGGVNYVYASVWILVFLWPYLRILKDRAVKNLPWVELWIIPAGLLAGWSNENMGPTCFLIAVGTMVFLKIADKKAPAIWMLEGSIVSLAGSILVIAAPGNFLRSSVIEKPSLFERVFSMMAAGVDYLFPAVLVVVILLLLRNSLCDGKIGTMHWTLLAGSILSYGAMLLSPHYPDRATFGTMVLLVILAVMLLGEVQDSKRTCKNMLPMVTVCFWVCAMVRMIKEMIF